MITVRVKKLLARQASFAALAGLFLAAPLFSYQILAPFWSTKIDSALRVRDAYYRTIFPDSVTYSLVFLSNAQKQEICERIASAPDSSNPWHDFLCGILGCNKDHTASGYFASAIALTQQDPGMTWALFAEFTRNHQNMWAERCLMHLEKLLLASGARCAPVIAQQLLHYAVQSEKDREYTFAFSYYAWAERFDPDQAWSGLHRLWNCIPAHPQLLFSATGDITKIFFRSWILQLAVFSHMYDWIRIFFIVFMIIVFTGAALKYLPRAVHPFADRIMPEAIPSVLKTGLPLAVILSFLSFGLVPFLWLIAFFIWRYCEKKEKVIVLIALLILVCAPLDARIRDAVIQARSTQSSLSLYIRALQEGYSEEVHDLSLKKDIIDRHDALAHAAAALCAIKKGDTATARSNADAACAARPADPVLQQYAGIAAYLAGDNKGAVSYFQTILNRYPDDAVARFNIAQCYARNSDTAMDLDFMKTLPPGGQTVLIDFINANNIYFPKNWPALRQCIMPTYTPAVFWTQIFPLYSGSWNTTKILWGASFMGIPPNASQFVSITLILFIILWSLSPGVRRQVAQISTCRLCKRIICRNCKKGEMCPSCAQATQFIRNVKTLATIQSRIIRNRRLTQNLVEYLLDICMPGGGMLFSGRYSILAVIVVVFLTAAVYALFLFLSNVQFVYPHWAAYGIMEKFPYLLAGYNLIFIIRAIYALTRKKETVLL